MQIKNEAKKKRKQRRRTQLVRNCVWRAEHVPTATSMNEVANKYSAKTTSEICNMAVATPLVLISNGEQTSASTLALGYPIFGPSRHVRTCYRMPYCSLGSLCRDPFRREEFRTLLHCFVLFLGISSCDPPLVGLDTESSEVVQETLHPLLFLPSRGNRAPY